MRTPEVEEWLRRKYNAFHPFAPESRFQDWVKYVERISVTLHPGRRATLRMQDPYAEAGCTVEIRWRMFKGDPLVVRYTVNADPGSYLPEVEFAMSYYNAAFYLELAKRPEPKVRRPARPAPGRPASLGFYSNLVNEHRQLVKKGHQRPTAELADRYKVGLGTMKSWLSRGRRYLRGE